MQNSTRVDEGRKVEMKAAHKVRAKEERGAPAMCLRISVIRGTEPEHEMGQQYRP